MQFCLRRKTVGCLGQQHCILAWKSALEDAGSCSDTNAVTRGILRFLSHTAVEDRANGGSTLREGRGGVVGPFQHNGGQGDIGRRERYACDVSSVRWKHAGSDGVFFNQGTLVPRAVHPILVRERGYASQRESPVSVDVGKDEYALLSSTGNKELEMKAVNTALVANASILAAKLSCWAVSGSGALLAEAIHSTCDILNQLLLRAGVQQSRRAPTRQHPYGFHREKYIYALMSAVGIFCIGSGASIVHGIQCILDPRPLEHMEYSLAVIGISGVIEFVSLSVAFKILRGGAERNARGIWKHVMSGRDPTTSAVLAEDAGAVAGLGIAGLASYLSWITGDPIFDAMGSIGVGVLMGGVAVMLIRNYKRFLIGQAIEPKMQQALVAHLKADPMVLCVVSPMSEEIGDGLYRFKADIQWSGDRIVHKYLESLSRDELYQDIRTSACEMPGEGKTLQDALDMAMMEFGRGVISTVGEEIDRLEAELRKICPGLLYVDLETERVPRMMGDLESDRDRCIIKPVSK